jgi:hypothetical protein
LPAVESVHKDAVVSAELADGFFADVGLPEDEEDLRLPEPALADRIRSLAWADSTISIGPVSGGQVKQDDELSVTVPAYSHGPQSPQVWDNFRVFRAQPEMMTMATITAIMRTTKPPP